LNGIYVYACRLSNGEHYPGENDDITFNQSRYFATVPENATIGTSVLQVFATDIDEGPNGQVSYSINRRQTDKDSVFRIDRTTGVIHVNGPLDFETKEVYELVVVARDNGIQPLETTVFVSIRVLDLNDNQMEINISFFSGKFTEKYL
jgi:protocadherin-16/23